jgi:hypothetical protein
VDGQIPLEIVHTKELFPTLKFVTAEFSADGELTLPVPDKTDQLPVPTSGRFALSDDVFEQIF